MTIFKTITGKGKPVVVMHGLGCDHRHMQPIVEHLSKNYCVINVDLPGRGNSDWHSDINSINNIAEIVVKNLPETATYIGWSFSGLVAFAIAARYPQRVRQIIGITTTPKFIASESWPALPQPGFKPTVVQALEKDFSHFLTAFFDNEFAAFNPKPAQYHELIKLTEHKANTNHPVLLKLTDICDVTDLRAEVKSLQCPIDLIWGEQDGSIPAIMFEKIKALNPHITTHIIPEAQHMPFWTHPIEFNRILDRIKR